MKASILIVEDEQITALSIKKNLEKLGYTIAGIEGRGEKAISLVKEKEPDIILMDIVLKGSLDGIETAEELHSFCSVPIIYMTAWSDDHTIHRAKLTEPYSYLVKPLRERELEIAIEIALFKHKLEEDLKHSEEKFRTLVEGIPDIVYRIDEEGNFIYVSDNIRELGYEPEELIGEHFSLLVHPEDVHEVSRSTVLPRLKAKPPPPEGAPKLFDERRSGERSTFDLNIRLIGKGPGGQGKSIIPTTINSFGIHRRKNPYGRITEHETMGIIKAKTVTGNSTAISTEIPVGRELNESGLTVHSSEDIVFKINHKGEFTYIAPEISSLGWEPGELLGKHFSSIVHIGDLKRIQRDQVLSEYFGKSTGDEEAPKLFDERRTRERATRGLEVRMNPGGPREISSQEENSIVWGEVNAAGEYSSSVIRRDKDFLGTIGVIRDITERKKSEEMVRRIAKEWQTTFDSLGDSISITSRDYTILRVNSAFQKTFKVREEEAVGKKCYEIVHGLDHPPSHCVHGEKQFHPKPRVTEFFEPNLNGYIETSMAPIPDGYVHVIKDITFRKRNEQEIERAKKAAEEANRAKTRFLAQMSHDLRTPLNGIMGFTQLLLDAEGEPEKKEMLESISHCGNVLLSFMNDLIDLTKLEFGKITLRDQPFSPGKLIRNLCGRFQLEAEAKGITLRLETEGPGADKVQGDPIRFEQILMNLINNAVKFTQSGEVSVVVSSQEDNSTEKTLVRVSVTDTGPGIEKNELEAIFEEYSQGSSSRNAGGTGLGLSIVKQLVKMMEGEITVESRPGKGSSFTVTVPFGMVKHEASPGEEPQEKAAEEKTKAYRILVAEDDRINQMLIKKILEKIGWKPELAVNGREALEKFKAREWDIILMDVNMPVMDGLESIRLIREEEKRNGKPPVTIISLTANAMGEDRQICLDAGADDYLAKPLDIRKLKGIINKKLS